MTALTIDRKAVNRRPDGPAAQLAMLGLREPPAIEEHRAKVDALRAEIERLRAAKEALTITIDSTEAHARVVAAGNDPKAVFAAREAVRAAKRQRDETADSIAKVSDELTEYRLAEIRDHDADVRELDDRRRQAAALAALVPLGEATFALGEKLRAGIAAAHADYPGIAPQLMRDLARRLQPGNSVGAYNVEALPALLASARRALAEAVTAYKSKWGV